LTYPDAIPDFSGLGPHGVRPGELPSRECRIFAHLLAQEFEPFLIQALYAAAVKLCFDHAKLFAYHGKIDTRLAGVLSMLPDITFTWRGQDRSTIPMDYFDPSSGAALSAASAQWRDLGCEKPDVMLLPSMMDWRHLGAFGRAPRFVLPRDRVPAINQALRDLGLAMTWWYCALAVPDHDTEADLEAWRSAMRSGAEIIADRHAASLVLVGDPETDIGRLPAGVLDARNLPDGVLGQSYVVSRARFLLDLVSTPWLWVAYGFGVPWAMRVSADVPVKFPGQGFVFPADPADSEKLAAAILAIIHETRDCPQWRATVSDRHGPAPNQIFLPMSPGPDARILRA
jgi:hypothetical protein